MEFLSSKNTTKYTTCVKCKLPREIVSFIFLHCTAKDLWGDSWFCQVSGFDGRRPWFSVMIRFCFTHLREKWKLILLHLSSLQEKHPLLSEACHLFPFYTSAVILCFCCVIILDMPTAFIFFIWSHYLPFSLCIHVGCVV